MQPCSDDDKQFVCKGLVSPEYGPYPGPESGREKCESIDHVSYNQFHDACYKVFIDPKTWKKAEEDCLSQGGIHLTSISDIAEQSYIQVLLSTNNVSEAWIGSTNKGV